MQAVRQGCAAIVADVFVDHALHQISRQRLFEELEGD
jgi:hypothetical protein